MGLVVAQFNSTVTTEMQAAAEAAAAERDAEIVATVEVPGAYDAPLAADRLARREEIDAVAGIGAAAQGLTDVSLDRDTPVTFGVSGPGMSGAEARERETKGAEAVNAAVDLVGVGK